MSSPQVPATNWAGNVTYRAGRVHRPESVPELRRLVAAARHLRALGTGHTFNAITDSPGDLVSLSSLPSTVDIDPERSTVTVGAPVRYGELARTLHDAGFALHNLGSLPHIGVAGACATGTHGSGTGALATAVTEVELVGPDGDLMTLNRDDQRFAGAVLALGAAGIVTRLTLDLQPTFDVVQHVYRDLPFDEYRERVGEIAASGYSVSAFTDWGPRVAQIWVKRRLDTPAPERPWPGAVPSDHPLHPVPGMPPENCTTQLGLPGPWHERLPHFRLEFTPSAGAEIQTEYLVPMEVAGAALAAVATARDAIAPVLQISEIRTVTGDDLWISPAYRRDSVAIHFTWVDDTAAVLPAIAAVEERLAPFDPRPHWGKLFIEADALADRYPRMGEFRRLVTQLDPDGKFRNELVERWIGATPGTP